MYRFAFHPRFLLGHAAVLALVALMVNLGLWQLRRLDEKRTYNARVEAQLSQPVAAFETAVADGSGEFRRVELTGRFDTAEEVLLRNRSFGGVSGSHVLTPLVRDRGPAVLVNRGWVPLTMAREWPQRAAAPPAGIVRVTGIVRTSESIGRFGPSDPAEGKLREVFNLDVARVAAQVPYEMAPVYVQMESPTPADGFPTPLPEPALSEGNHLSYAGQWFIFSAIAAIGWLVLLRSSARRRQLGAPASSEPGGGTEAGCDDARSVVTTSP